MLRLNCHAGKPITIAPACLAQTAIHPLKNYQGTIMRHRLSPLNVVKSAALALLFLSSAAHAALITGAGTWSAATPSTAYSQPDATWSFSFNLPDQIATNPTAKASNVSYFLNGQLVSTTLQGYGFTRRPRTDCST